jgi:hypothetical protein
MQVKLINFNLSNLEAIPEQQLVGLWCLTPLSTITEKRVK